MIRSTLANHSLCAGEWFDFDALVEGDNIALVIDCDCSVQLVKSVMLCVVCNVQPCRTKAGKDVLCRNVGLIAYWLVSHGEP
jgi:hypothetical protein